MLLNTYLTFDGDCREAFDFYLSVFGGSLTALQTFGDGLADMGVPDDKKDQILHISLPIGASTLMGSDNPLGDPVGQGSNFSIVVVPDSRGECDRLFEDLGAHGEVTMPLQETFWGAYYGQLKDRFGINWMFNVAL